MASAQKMAVSPSLIISSFSVDFSKLNTRIIIDIGIGMQALPDEQQQQNPRSTLAALNVARRLLDASEPMPRRVRDSEHQAATNAVSSRGRPPQRGSHKPMGGAIAAADAPAPGAMIRRRNGFVQRGGVAINAAHSQAKAQNKGQVTHNASASTRGRSCWILDTASTRPQSHKSRHRQGDSLVGGCGWGLLRVILQNGFSNWLARFGGWGPSDPM